MARLNGKQEEQLCTWLSSKKYFFPLYKASVDGCNAKAFHQTCDNRGPTVTVCFNKSGHVFGGYTSVNWTSTGSHVTDENAFLFRLQSSATSFDPKRYPVKTTEKAIYGCSNYGPSFGSGYDFSAFHDTVEKSDMLYKGNGAVKSDSYNWQGESATSPRLPNTAFAWRIVSKGSHQNLMSYMENYAPPEGSKVKAVNLLLLGAVGAGKSSFCNSIDSIFQREVTSIARCGNAERSLTTTYRRYRVRSSETGEALKLRLCDTRGLESEGGLDIVDLMAVLEGHIPDRFEFNPTISVTSDTRGYNKNPTPDDNIHCIAFVIDGTTIEVFPEKMLHLFKSLQQKANAKGCPQVIILTKADKVSSEVFADVGTMFYSNAIGDLVEAAGQLFGLPRSYVFPVKNYEDEVEINETVNLPLLLCLKQATKYADNYIKDSLASD